MPDQSEHDRPENLVEENTELEKDAARSLAQAAGSHASLEGYYAMNNTKPDKKLEEEATADRQKESGHREKGHPVP